MYDNDLGEEIVRKKDLTGHSQALKHAWNISGFCPLCFDVDGALNTSIAVYC